MWQTPGIYTLVTLKCRWTHLTKNNAKWENINSFIINFSTHHLRSHPIWRPNNCHPSSVEKRSTFWFIRHHSCKAKVSHNDRQVLKHANGVTAIKYSSKYMYKLTYMSDETVVRCQVPMNYRIVVEICLKAGPPETQTTVNHKIENV